MPRESAVWFSRSKGIGIEGLASPRPMLFESFLRQSLKRLLRLGKGGFPPLIRRQLLEDRGRQLVLFPIRLDDAVFDTGEAWAGKLRDTRHIGDFRRWKDHDSYQKAFQRLLRDLTAAAERERGEK